MHQSEKKTRWKFLPAGENNGIFIKSTKWKLICKKKFSRDVSVDFQSCLFNTWCIFSAIFVFFFIVLWLAELVKKLQIRILLVGSYQLNVSHEKYAYFYNGFNSIQREKNWPANHTIGNFINRRQKLMFC